jgi:hypothetical protein
VPAADRRRDAPGRLRAGRISTPSAVVSDVVRIFAACGTYDEIADLIESLRN